MRALVRASGMKLDALQYHFRTWDEMLRALVGYIGEEYQRAFDSMHPEVDSLGIREIAVFMLDDSAGDSLSSDRLWPQLLAMEQVEPLVSDLVEGATLFLGSGRRWEGDANAVRDTLLEFIDAKYREKS